MENIIKKILNYEYLAFVLLIKDVIEIVSEIIGWIKLPNSKPFNMNYLEIGLHFFIAFWLFFMIKQYKYLKREVETSKVITKYLQYQMKFRGHMQASATDEVLLPEIFSDGELLILSHNGYIKTKYSA